MQQKIKPMFMWAGGKTKMLKYHTPLMPRSITEYSEPFLGGGAMFLYVMQNYDVKKAYLNDSNEGIINIFRQVQTNVDEFCRLVNIHQARYLPLSKEGRGEFYNELRHKHAYEYTRWDEVYEASVLYFLMKTGFNGIWQINKSTNGRFGTPKGLLNQKDKVYDEQLVRGWSRLLQRAEVYCGDYEQCPTGDFTYLDPPYRDSFTTYGSGWGDDETLSLVKYAREIKGSVFLCNRCDGTDFFERVRGDFQIRRFPVTYTAGRRKKGIGGFEAKKATEILLYK